ncbi:hypothetical protein MMC17_001003 [Xylographa soralifera]|nr:hypothetical protein [Xylographa soralifera]
MPRLARLQGRLTDHLLSNRPPPYFLEPRGHSYRAHLGWHRKYASSFGSQDSPSFGPDVQVPEDGQNERSQNQNGSAYKSTAYKMFESAASTFASLTVLAFAGFAYHKYYKDLVLRKMENAFKPGDPILELAALGLQEPTNILEEDEEHWLRRPEQAKIDAIINGTDRGHYYLMVGEKGTGKSSMLLDAMQKVDGEGVSVSAALRYLSLIMQIILACFGRDKSFKEITSQHFFLSSNFADLSVCQWFEAHADLEIFRIRLGKALDFEFHEDYIGSLFSIRGPRDTTALLDIERAFNKLEKVALNRRKIVGRPLVLIINSIHLLRDDEDGRDLLELVQQRAEQWAASNLVTVLLNSDDYWVYERLKGLATRMEVLAISTSPNPKPSPPSAATAPATSARQPPQTS